MSVVAGVIVHGDLQWKPAEKLLNQVFDKHVPIPFRKGFIFHAKDVFSHPKYREIWSRESRMAFMDEMTMVPDALDLPIFLGMVRRNATQATTEFLKRAKMTAAQFDHVLALHYALARADFHIRQYCGPEEIATVVAEDVPDMRAKLRKIPDLLRRRPFVLSSQYLKPSKRDIEAGRPPEPMDFSIQRIVDGIHFAAKESVLLLQLADLCAFTFRRYFANQPRGREMAKSLTGHDFHDPDWSGPASSGSFRSSLHV